MILRDGTISIILRQRGPLWLVLIAASVYGFLGLSHNEAIAQRRYVARLNRAAYAPIYLPDSTGRMEPLYLVTFSSSAKVKNMATNREVATFNAEIIRNGGQTSPHTGAMPFAFRQAFTIDEPGVYEVERTRQYRAEDGSSGSYPKDYWLVNVHWPRSVIPIQVDKHFFPGENPVISFAAAELTDLTSYSYGVYRLPDMVRVDTGNGAVIQLGKYVNDLENAKTERQFEVRGYYRQRTFSFLTPGDSVPHETKWQFQVKRPGLDFAVMWDGNANTPESELPALPMNLQGGYNPRTFGYYYFGRKGKALILSEAKISNLQIQSNPPEFLQGWLPPVANGIFTDVGITPDEAFISSDSRGAGQLVELTITFSTQYETGKRFVYRAIVY
jgi:hypothetical protein